MTSTSFNIGLGDTTRSSSKVLKPPGGGSSDIFGAADTVEQSPRRGRNQNHLQSSVFGPTANGNETPARNKPGNDSHNRLFGPADNRPASCTKDRLKSNISLGGDETDLPSVKLQLDGEKTPQDGNPVTGEGYTATNGDKEHSVAPAVTTNGAHSAPAPRTRVPPGGFSSGLW